jgi:glucosamine-6-phosphate deaminase
MLQSIAAENPEIERTSCRVFGQSREASLFAAQEIARLVRRRQEEGRPCVLGLATGSSPRAVYAELVRMHRDEELSFRNVVTFNLDEYYPIRPESLQSYVRFMRTVLFDQIDIDPANVHIPDGSAPADQVTEYCKRYEDEIAAAGGIDIQLLGIGRTGHIGFNEPGSGRDSRTRLITLDKVTRRDAASDFFGEENVPMRGITMGVGTILEARRLILLAFGENKAEIIAKAVEGVVTNNVPASFLQEHGQAEILLDRAAAAALTRSRSPWKLGPVEWDDARIRRAVVWLAFQVTKPVLKLTAEDYNENGLQDLLAAHGPAYDLNLRAFRHLQGTITGWPAGKPAHEKKPGDRPQLHDDIYPKRILVFSPHPDDDVISMGGTLIRLAAQGHEVHVAYQTSGNIAVFDDDAVRFSEFACAFDELHGIEPGKTHSILQGILTALGGKSPGEIDTDEVQKIKGLIRRGEARAAGRCCGISPQRLHFLDMPFYETGQVEKKPLSDADVQIVVDLLQRIQPHQIYAAGDLSDPHGTHRVCLSAVLEACQRVKYESWFSLCDIWLYRGAWQEWEPHEIDMAVPLSPDEVRRKRSAIFKHQSQKDRALFPGADMREFWQRAEARNAETARLFDRLGLAEYAALEGFVRYSGDAHFA